MEWLKSVWARWKVQVSVVGGVLVVATAFGTCSYEPPVVLEVSEATPATETTETATIEASSTTEGDAAYTESTSGDETTTTTAE